MDDGYVVQEILAHRRRRGKLQWQVKWKGWTDPTWEPAAMFLNGINTVWDDYNRTAGLKVIDI